MDLCVNLDLGGNLDTYTKVIASDGLIGTLPESEIHKIMYLHVPDGNIEQVAEKAFEYIEGNKNKKIVLLFSAGSFNSFTFNSDDYFNAPQSYLDTLLGELTSKTESVFVRLTNVLNNAEGKLVIATLIPLPFMLTLKKSDKKFMSSCYLSVNQIIREFNSKANVSTPFLREVVEYRRGIIPDTNQRKFGHKKFYVDDYHLNSNTQKKMMEKCVNILNSFGQL